MKLGDFLNKMASKTNSQNDPAFISLLSNSAIAGAEIEDALANSLDTALMTIEGAKNSSEVKNHFQATLLRAIDEDLLGSAEEMGIKAEMEAEKSTYRRVKMAIDQHRKMVEKLKANPGDPNKDADLKRLTEQIQKQQADIIRMQSDFDAQNLKRDADHQAEILDLLINNSLAGKNYIFEGNSPETNVQIARAVLKGKLAEKGALVVNENGTLKVKQAASPELDYLDAGNKPVTYGGLIDQILADSKLLKITEAPQEPTRKTITVPPSGGDQNPNLDGYRAAMARAKEDLQ